MREPDLIGSVIISNFTAGLYGGEAWSLYQARTQHKNGMLEVEARMVPLKASVMWQLWRSVLKFYEDLYPGLKNYF
jgi:hypothetical protein